MLDKVKSDIKQKSENLKASLDKKKEIRRIKREKAKAEKEKREALAEQARIAEEKRRAQQLEEEKQRRLAEIEAEKNRLRDLSEKELQVEMILAIRGFYKEYVDLKDRVDFLSTEIIELEEQNNVILNRLDEIDYEIESLKDELEVVTQENIYISQDEQD